MPDREKVLKALEHHKETAVCNGCPYAGDDDTPQGNCPVYDDALALLREQEPVKVVRVQNIQTTIYDWGEKVETHTDFYCPDCKRLIASGFSAKFPYCPWCRRAVKWDADEGV